MNDATLVGSLSGSAVFRGEAGFESKRRSLAWNRRLPDRHPRAIVAAMDVVDVQRAVAFAREQDLVVAAKSGGHSCVESSIRDDALVIDTSAMNSIIVDQASQKAIVGAGAKSEQVASALAEYGLAFPVGHCRSTGMGGYLLGGGLGINWNLWGPACYSVVGLEIVDDQGNARSVNDDNDPDLMWLARGCGPSFPGVVTAYHIEAKPMPASIRMSVCVFPLEGVPAATAWFEQLTPTLSCTVEAFAVLAGPVVGEVFGFDAPSAGRYLVIGAFAFENDEDAAERVLRPFRDVPYEPIFALHGIPREFTDLFGIMDVFLPPDGTRMTCDSVWSDNGTSDVVGALAQHMRSSPSPITSVLCFQPPRAELRDDACFSMMRANCITLYGAHEDAADDRAAEEWVAQGVELLAPFTAGYWVNETNLAAGSERARRSFTSEVWERARAVRSHYDPHGRFADYLGIQE